LFTDTKLRPSIVVDLCIRFIYLSYICNQANQSFHGRHGHSLRITRSGKPLVLLHRPASRNPYRSKIASTRCMGVVLRRSRIRQPDGGRHMPALYGRRRSVDTSVHASPVGVCARVGGYRRADPLSDGCVRPLAGEAVYGGVSRSTEPVGRHPFPDRCVEIRAGKLPHHPQTAIRDDRHGRIGAPERDAPPAADRFHVSRRRITRSPVGRCASSGT